jgi:hypothetical protein
LICLYLTVFLLSAGQTAVSSTDAALQLQSHSGSAFHSFAAHNQNLVVGGYEAPQQSGTTVHQDPVPAGQGHQGCFNFMSVFSFYAYRFCSKISLRVMEMLRCYALLAS